MVLRVLVTGRGFVPSASYGAGCACRSIVISTDTLVTAGRGEVAGLCAALGVNPIVGFGVSGPFL